MPDAKNGFLFVLLIGFTVTTVSADDAPVMPVQGGTIIPYQEEYIRLVSGEIDIYLERDSYRVIVDYIFNNTGPATEITMGFPNETDWMYGLSISDFQALVDGEKQEIYRRVYRETEKTWGPESAPDYYYECFDTSFAPGQTRRIQNEYSQWYFVDYDQSGRSASYILTTGAYWKGVIDEIRVRIHFLERPEDHSERTLFLPPEEADAPQAMYGTVVTPRPTGTIEDGLEILLTDVEPETDIDVNLPMPVVNWVSADSELQSSRYSYAPENVLDNDTDISWVEGEEGPGEGSTLRLSLSSTIGGGKVEGAYEIEAVGMINGYAATEELYRANNRVKTAELNWTHPLPVKQDSRAIWHLKYSSALQYYRFPEPVYAGEISITLQEVFPGSRYDDTCVAEVVVVPASLED